MVPVSEYLKKLLFQYDCLVVPELGGFILHSVPATFVESTNTFLPPRKKIAFNEALKLDDGLLISYMVLHEDLTREEVLGRIRSFADDLKQQVRQSGSYALEGIGLFSGNEEGRLQFDPELRHNFQGDSYGLQPVIVSLVSSAEEAEEAAEAIVLALPVGQSAGAGVETESEVKSERKPYVAWAATFLLVGSLGLMSYMTVQRSPSQAASSLNPFDISFTHETPASVEEPKPVDNTPVAIEASPVAQPVVIAEAPAEKPVEVKAAPVVRPQVTAPVAPKMQYVAIAGSFASKRNARKLLRQLRRHGFKTAFILPVTKRGELVKVAAMGSNDRQEVVAALDAVSQQSGSHAWVSQMN